MTGDEQVSETQAEAQLAEPMGSTPPPVPEVVSQVETKTSLPQFTPLGPSDPDIENLWQPYLDRLLKRLVKRGKNPKGIGRYRRGSEIFIQWAVRHGVTPENCKAVGDYYARLIETSSTNKLDLNFNRLTAKLLTEDAMRDPEDLEQEDAELRDGEEEVEASEEDLQEEQPRRRRTPASAQLPNQPQVVFVQQPTTTPRQRGNYERAAPRSRQTPAQRVLPRNERVRVFKRGPGGKRLYVNDYTMDEIGNQSLHRFVKEYVDPDFGDPSGVTTYEVCEVDANDREKGVPYPITIESTPAQPPDETITQARGALDLIRELRGMDEEKNAKSKETIDEAKKRAASTGDMSQLMMLMMMERMMGGSSSNGGGDVVKLLEQLLVKKPELHALSGSVPMPITLPPPPAPPPPPENQLGPIVKTLLEAQLAPKAEVPKPTLTDQLKELAMLKELFGPRESPEVAALKTEVALLRDKLSQPAQVGGIEGALANFEKLTGVVKTLAPQVNMGGLTGALQSILTPELGKALGGVIAQGIGGAQTAAQQQAKPSAQAQTQAQTQTQAQAQAQKNPPEVERALAALKVAQTEGAQVDRMVELVTALYEATQYRAQLEPALQALLASNTGPARALALEILQRARPEIANQPLADKVVAAIISKAGGTPPPELLGQVPATETKPEVKAPDSPAAAAKLDEAKPVETAEAKPGSKNGAHTNETTTITGIQPLVETQAPATAAVTG